MSMISKFGSQKLPKCSTVLMRSLVVSNRTRRQHTASICQSLTSVAAVFPVYRMFCEHQVWTYQNSRQTTHQFCISVLGAIAGLSIAGLSCKKLQLQLYSIGQIFSWQLLNSANNAAVFALSFALLCGAWKYKQKESKGKSMPWQAQDVQMCIAAQVMQTAT